ncbi:MAG: putative nicotinamide N-methyase [Hyphomicrobiaceae bacterium]
MSNNDLRSPRSLGQWPAVWTEIEIPTEPSLTLGAFTVDRLEERIDAQALLNADRVPEPPYWALVWIGARALAAHLFQHPPRPDQSVLDLGCGLGVSGVAAAQSGAQVVFGDYAPECLPFVEATLEAHQLEHCEVRLLDFTSDRLEHRFDLIVAADIVYDPESYGSLAEFLDMHLSIEGEILLTESLRADAKLFLATLVERGFVDDVTASWVTEDGQRMRTWLHRLRRK